MENERTEKVAKIKQLTEYGTWGGMKGFLVYVEEYKAIFLINNPKREGEPIEPKAEDLRDEEKEMMERYKEELISDHYAVKEKDIYGKTGVLRLRLRPSFIDVVTGKKQIEELDLETLRWVLWRFFGKGIDKSESTVEDCLKQINPDLLDDFFVNKRICRRLCKHISATPISGMFKSVIRLGKENFGDIKHLLSCFIDVCNFDEDCQIHTILYTYCNILKFRSSHINNSAIYLYASTLLPDEGRHYYHLTRQERIEIYEEYTKQGIEYYGLKTWNPTTCAQKLYDLNKGIQANDDDTKQMKQCKEWAKDYLDWLKSTYPEIKTDEEDPLQLSQGRETVCEAEETDGTTSRAEQEEFLWPSYATTATAEQKRDFEKRLREACCSGRKGFGKDVANILDYYSKDDENGRKAIIDLPTTRVLTDWIKLFGYPNRSKNAFYPAWKMVHKKGSSEGPKTAKN